MAARGNFVWLPMDLSHGSGGSFGCGLASMEPIRLHRKWVRLLSMTTATSDDN